MSIRDAMFQAQYQRNEGATIFCFATSHNYAFPLLEELLNQHQYMVRRYGVSLMGTNLDNLSGVFTLARSSSKAVITTKDNTIHFFYYT